MTDNSIEVDPRVLEGCRRGEQNAFHSLVETLKRPAYFHALNLTGNHHDALDLSQEAFVRAWRSFAAYDHTRPFYPWFYRLLRNLCLNRHRGTRRRHAALDRLQDTLVTTGKTHGDALDDLARRETAALVNTTLAALGPEEREVILLKDLHGYSYRQIGELLDLPAGTVMSRLFHARRKFRARYPAGQPAPAQS
ncbi:MAG: RNA polymerase sigma factor [Puniceicoccaceae bacterium]|nr:MAG: RNA polymerase sigma factor [Puniceicoccaceae bacterium]